MQPDDFSAPSHEDTQRFLRANLVFRQYDPATLDHIIEPDLLMRRMDAFVTGRPVQTESGRRQYGPGDRVAWGEIEPAASVAFSARYSAGGLEWAERAWAALENAQLTNCPSDVDHNKVFLRLLALASFYRDWLHVVGAGTFGDNFGHWAESLMMSPFVLGQLLGPHFDNSAGTEGARVKIALEELVPRFRQDVVEVLAKGFGGRDGLFMALWKSTSPITVDTVASEINYDTAHSEIVNRMAGYEWIMDGCPSRRQARSWRLSMALLEH
jgi:hypothetical protein